MKKYEKVIVVLCGIALSFMTGYIFYNSLIFGGVISIPACVFVWKFWKRHENDKRKRIIESEFEEMLSCLASALRTGYAIDNAFFECRKELVSVFGKEAPIIHELNIICHGLKMNEPVDKLMYGMAVRTKVKSISEFAQVLSIARKSGGDFITIIRQNASEIRNKRQVLAEIETMVTAKKYEGLIMNIMPPGIIVYLRFTSPGYIAVLYNNPAGIMVMTVILIIYISGICLAQHIMNFDKENVVRYPSVLKNVMNDKKKSQSKVGKSDIILRCIYEKIKADFAIRLKDINDKIRALLVGNYSEKIIEAFWFRLIKMEILFIIAGIVICILGFLENPDNVPLFVVMALAVLLYLPYSSISGIKKAVNSRDMQMLLDYPDIISKFSVLMSAGITMKSSLERIVNDYRNQRKSGYCKKHYIYEELAGVLNKIAAGMDEGAAYEEFGRKVNVLSYIRFATMLSQNLKKGNKVMLEQLNVTAIDSINERKESLKRIGEKASSKLLFPMMIQFIMILVIIMYPAITGL